MKLTLLLFTFIAGGIVAPVHVAAGNYAPKTKNDSVLSTKVNQWMSKSGGLRFIENKGQMFDMQRKAVPNVLYQASAPGMNIYVTTTGLSYVFTYPIEYSAISYLTYSPNIPFMMKTKKNFSCH